MNTELVKHFMMQIPDNKKMSMIPYNIIVHALHKHFNGNWSWEVLSETFMEDVNGKNVMTMVALYIPGHVYTGYAYSNINSYFTNHLKALHNAALPFMEGNNNSKESNEVGHKVSATVVTNYVDTPPINYTADQINDSINNQQQNDPPTFDNTIDKSFVDDDDDDTPFGREEYVDPVTKKPIRSNQQVSGTANNAPSPDDNPRAYSKEQLEAMEDFKRRNDIKDDTMFNNYVSIWKTGYTKKDLNKYNIDDFLNHMKKIEDMGS